MADQRPDTQPTHYLATRQAYKDFVLRAEFWVSEDANSGIYIRCTDVRPMTDRTCHEANIFDKRPDPSYATGGIVWLAKAPSPGAAHRRQVEHDGSHRARQQDDGGVERRADRETTEARDGAGVIGLQYAGGMVKFRRLQIRRL